MPIDWTDENCQITPHFTVKDALWLPTWNRLANEADGLNDGIKNNLIDLYMNCMEPLRDLLGPIIVHVTYRPEAYNKLIGGAPASAHMIGKACDWHSSIHSINETKDLILLHNMLEILNIRLEQGTPTWCHTDTMPVKPGGNRYFLP